MYIPEIKTIHPNILKHAVELVGERNILPATVLNKLYKEDFSDSTDGCKSCLKFLMDEKVNDNIIKEVLNKAIVEIYTLDNPYLIVSKYVHSNRVRSSIRNVIMKFNNNKNYSFDLDSILNEFEKFVSASPSAVYDFSRNTIVHFLIYTYSSHFQKSDKGQQVILTEINSRGTQVKGADGEISLMEMDSINVEDDKFKIDFPIIAKNIYEGSEVLFNISNKICYDIFSHYMNKEYATLKSDVYSIFKNSFSSEDIGPVIVSDNISYNTNTDFGKNTIRQRIMILDMVYDTICNSSDESDIRDLFITVVNMDLTNQNSSNIGTLFKHKSGPSYDRHNMSIFLKILKGCQSLRSFIKYLKINNINVSKDDYILFRDPSYYKRFNSLKDYLSLKEVTSEVIEEGKNIEDGIGYFTNDECYEVINKKHDYNLYSLSSFVKNEMSRRMSSPINVDHYIKDIKSRYEFCQYLYSHILNIKDKCIDNDIDPFDPRAYEVYSSTLSDFDEYLSVVIFPNDKYLQKAIIEKHNIRVILRYLNLRIAYYSHIIKLLDMSKFDMEDVMLYLNRELLQFPLSIRDLVSDTSKLVSDVPLCYYLEEGSNPSNDIELKKQYYIMANSISEEHKELFKFLGKWIDNISISLESYGISPSINKIPKILQEKSIGISFKDRISTNAFENFKNKYTIKHGFLYNRGKLLKYKGYYVHENGYLIDEVGYSIVSIKDNQTFD